MAERDPYPLTVIRTRYGGSYEGGMYAAFPVEFHRIPHVAVGDDTTCSMFWASPASRFIGVGGTPLKAIDDLRPRIEGMSFLDLWKVVEPAISDWQF